MLTRNILFRDELQKLIEEEITRRMENVVIGHSAIDFPEYKHQVGVIEGLRVALELCEQAQSITDRKA
jgi:hypothetical protein